MAPACALFLFLSFSSFLSQFFTFFLLIASKNFLLLLLLFFNNLQISITLSLVYFLVQIMVVVYNYTYIYIYIYLLPIYYIYIYTHNFFYIYIIYFICCLYIFLSGSSWLRSFWFRSNKAPYSLLLVPFREVMSILHEYGTRWFVSLFYLVAIPSSFSFFSFQFLLHRLDSLFVFNLIITIFLIFLSRQISPDIFAFPRNGMRTLFSTL